MEIANPIYDAVFKYMMEDNLVARLLVSSIIGEEVVHLDPKPQEHTIEKQKTQKKEENDDIQEFPNLTIYRLDFSAKIKTADGGHRLIIIEMQKADLPSDIMRFRRYLGEQYINPENSLPSERGDDALQIYSLYFLGKELGICDTPVLSVMPQVKNMSNGRIIRKKSKFIDSLNHQCWIVQISCLKKRRRNELEQLLSIFDQSNRTSNIHILNVNEKDYPPKYRPIIRRLKSAASDPKVKEKMKVEDEFIRYLRSFARMETTKALEEMNKKMQETTKAFEEINEKMQEKDKTIEEKDKALEEKDKTIESFGKMLEEQNELIKTMQQTMDRLAGK